MTPINILAIGAHPDDIEFGCCPVLIKEGKKGNHVRMLVLSRGEAGSAGTPEGREQESRRAAQLIGASIGFLDLGGDCHMQYLPENAFKLAREIRTFKPAIVLAPHREENQHPDHAVAGRLTRDACRLARYGGLEPLKPLQVHRVENLFFYHITRHPQEPDIVVDISDVMEAWEAAMNCHESQVQSKGYIDLQKTGARLLGLTIGTEYALGLFANDPIRVENVSDIRHSSRNF
jgi:bacillithiol biosynthesis deacetylase BshB1